MAKRCAELALADDHLQLALQAGGTRLGNLHLFRLDPPQRSLCSWPACKISTLRAPMVRAEGLEPPRLAPLEPKSSASTNSATPAGTAAPLALAVPARRNPIRPSRPDHCARHACAEVGGTYIGPCPVKSIPKWLAIASAACGGRRPCMRRNELCSHRLAAPPPSCRVRADTSIWTAQGRSGACTFANGVAAAVGRTPLIKLGGPPRRPAAPSSARPSS